MLNSSNFAPELRLLTLAARPGYPGCTTRRWSWLWVREAIRQTGAYQLPRKANGRPVRKLRIDTLLHPKKITRTVETLDVPVEHSSEVGYSNSCLISDGKQKASSPSARRRRCIYNVVFTDVKIYTILCTVQFTINNYYINICYFTILLTLVFTKIQLC